MQFESSVAAALPELVALRHEFHQHPELRFEEQWTSDRIASFLDANGIAYRRGFAKGTGIVAEINHGPGKTIALRSDIDALELQECTGLPYASLHAGRMHACGHDGHMACLCGAAKILAAHREALRGTVRFIFQPAEELGAGGRMVVEEGVLDGVDAVFALHAWPSVPLGKFGLKSGPLMASADWFRVEVRGRGCHGADPAAGVDPVVVAAHIVTALQTIVSRELNPWDAAVVTIGQIQAGFASNIVPETAQLTGTFRALTGEVRNRIAASILRIAEATASTFRASASVEFRDDTYAPLVNDPAMTEFARETIVEAFGQQAIFEVEHPSMTSEDFSFYLEKVPGAYLWMGNHPDADRAMPPLHSPYFNFNDTALAIGVRFWAHLATRFLSEP